MNKAVILAGGQGKRMKADIPKPMFKVLNEPMLEWVISACEGAGIADICVVKGYKGEIIDSYLNGRYETALQTEQLGTGHAVMQAVPFLKDGTGENTLVLCGDAPLIDSDTISQALEIHLLNDNSVTVITSEIENPKGYGRIIRSGDSISGIVEEKDADDITRQIKEVNSGAYWFKTADLVYYLGKLGNNNVQGEYYLTDTVALAVSSGNWAGAYKSSNPQVILGTNTRKELYDMNQIARQEIIEKHMENGVEFTCLDGVIIERTVEIGANTEILPGTILRGSTKIGSDCVIGPNSIITDCTVGDGTVLNNVQASESSIGNGVKIGPWVQIRPGSTIKDKVKIGDFVEIKNSVIGEATSVAHLTYIGDSDVGRKCNFGCGTVTVNYDGIKKDRCQIGDHCFIGCNTNLIAPVTLGDWAYTAAGTTVAKNVPEFALAIDRGDFKVKENYTKKKFGDKINGVD